MVNQLRHQVIWKLLRLPVYVFLRITFNYSCQKEQKIPGPFLLIANHVTDFDPLMVGCSFPQQMYFVASEHLFRKGFLSKLLIWLVAPIPRIKGSTDMVSALNIVRTLRHNSNVGLFAEGDRSWNGITGPLHPTTVRLIRMSKAALVTYRLSGGYLSSPRWSRTLRRGKTSGRLMNVYPPDRLAAMADQEIMSAVMGDIYEDAYEAQWADPVKYKGKKLAEGLERALYTCPVCKGLCTLHSKDNWLYCGCGMRVRYNEFGFFEGKDCPFQTAAEWDEWQNYFLYRYLISAVKGPILKDGGQSLWWIDTGHQAKLVAKGTLALYRDHLQLGGFSVPLPKISHMGVYGPATIVFSAEGINYEIRSAISRSGRKYLTVFNLLTDGMSATRSNMQKTAINGDFEPCAKAQ